MPVKPRLLAKSCGILVIEAEERCDIPTKPARPPEMSIVLMIIFLGSTPLALAAAGLTPLDLRS